MSVPTVVTFPGVGPTPITAALTGGMTNLGGHATATAGFVWDTASHSLPGNVPPSSSGYANDTPFVGTITGPQLVAVTALGLNPGVTYYVRTYGNNADGYAYGSEISFTTPALGVYTVTVVAPPTNSAGTQVYQSQAAGLMTFTGATWTGLDGTAIFGNTSSTGSTAITNSPSIGVNLTVSGDVIVGVMSNAGSPTGVTPESSFTIKNSAVNGTVYNSNLAWDEYLIANFTGPQHVRFTWTNTCGALLLAQAYQSSSGTAVFSQKASGVSSVAGNPFDCSPASIPSRGDLLTVWVQAGFAGASTPPTLLFTVFDSFGNTFTLDNSISGATWTTTPTETNCALSYFSCLSCITKPTTTTQAATDVRVSTAVANGNITDLGGAGACSRRGFVYGLVNQGVPGNVSPGSTAYTNFVDNVGSFSTGAFAQTLHGLHPAATYYICAYSAQGAGYTYGAVQTFTTQPTRAANATAAFFG